MLQRVKNPFSKIEETNKIFNLYFPSGSFFFISPRELNKHKNFINKNNSLCLITSDKENIDINNIKDWNLAKRHVN
jgi:CMP-N-acetylneuraminic acid synthetase